MLSLYRNPTDHPTQSLSPPSRSTKFAWFRRHPWMSVTAGILILAGTAWGLYESRLLQETEVADFMPPPSAAIDQDVSPGGGVSMGETLPRVAPPEAKTGYAFPPPYPVMPNSVKPQMMMASRLPSTMSGTAMMAEPGLSPSMVMQPEPASRERYQDFSDNPVKLVAESPVSTFSIDVDSGSYANVRRMLESGYLPPVDAVRVEEMLNAFTYAYPAPGTRDVPFSLTTEMAPAFWNSDLRLLRVGLKGYEVPAAERPAANLVFLIDVSGSMDSPNKLPLLKASLKMLANSMSAKDHISIVTYAGDARVALEPTSGDDHATIRDALDTLDAAGTTAGGAGLELAYRMAEKGRIDGGINRILLATDGDFNVGVQNVEALVEMVAKKRRTGIALTTLGFGDGNYHEELMERIADVGNGNYAYIDSLREGRRVLVGQLTSALLTIARDVKIQVEFNPALVAEYRLIGYENRMLRREDFANDKVDAGELGAGHTVTALYELTLADSETRRIDPLRYGDETAQTSGEHGDELAFVRLRYKLPGEESSKLIERPLPASMAQRSADAASEDLRFAGAVAAFGQKLRDGTYLGDFGYDRIVELARTGLGTDPRGERREFIQLVEIAKALDAP